MDVWLPCLELPVRGNVGLFAWSARPMRERCEPRAREVARPRGVPDARQRAPNGIASDVTGKDTRTRADPREPPARMERSVCDLVRGRPEEERAPAPGEDSTLPDSRRLAARRLGFATPAS